MAHQPVSTAPFSQQTYVVASTTAQTTLYQNLCGSTFEVPDLDILLTGPVMNSQGLRNVVLVQNTSGSTIAAGTPLNWVSGYWGTQVQPCPVGQIIRGYAPAYVNGSAAMTIPNNAFFMMVKNGPTSALSDGTAIAAGDPIGISQTTAGQVHTLTELGGGELYSATTASAAITNTLTATAFSNSYTIPANMLQAGDTIKIHTEGIITAHNASDTLTIQLLIGATVVATTGAVTNAANDEFVIDADIQIRTNGSSGTFVASGLVVDGTPGTATAKSFLLASTTINTTTTQLISVVATWSAASSSDSVRMDQLDVQRFNNLVSGQKAGTALAAAAGGSSVAFRLQSSCWW
jgi:hypothetical protein